MNFEEAMQKLEKITQELEEGNLPLEESLKKFEQGMDFINFCEKKLEEVEKRIRVLIKEEGRLKLEIPQSVKEKKEKGQEDIEINVENGLLFEENDHK
ncbi:exodeoxyribonuclease VII small subunit [Candidatus Aerophobetes bacterium]|nr:exodeoxyribonuclease VII small subunit [Candidatus Aerophobetes bacterium]